MVSGTRTRTYRCLESARSRVTDNEFKILSLGFGLLAISVCKLQRFLPSFTALAFAAR